MRRWLVALIAMLAASVHAQDRFAFAVVGDAPYFAFEEAPFRALLDALGREPLAFVVPLDFVVHVGDVKSGNSPCTDELLGERGRMLDAAPLPLVLAPGDNDWTDCWRRAAGGYDPVERLARVREVFFAEDVSLGRRKLRLERQPGRAENARWELGGVVFVTLNVPGSFNNVRMPAEHAARMADNFDWLDDTVTRADRPDIRGLVIVAHADPRFGVPPARRDGYVAYVRVLAAQAQWLAKPVLLAHGDGHVFHDDRPLPGIPNFRRVESFGSPAIAAVRVTVEPRDPGLFVISTDVPEASPP